MIKNFTKIHVHVFAKRKDSPFKMGNVLKLDVEEINYLIIKLKNAFVKYQDLKLVIILVSTQVHKY